MTRLAEPDTASRYSSRRPQSQAWAWVFGVLFGLLVATLVVVMFRRYGPADASAEVRGYRVIDSGSVSATLQISRDPSRDAACLLTARGRSREEVGHAIVRVPAEPGGRAVLEVTRTIPTTARAVLAEASRCVPLRPGAPVPFDASTDHS